MTLGQREMQLRTEYEQAFGRTPECLVRAPGRVNLIGEHTDYNDGYVLPAAIERDVLIAVGRSGGTRLDLLSTDIRRRASFDVSGLEPSAGEPWANYLAGVAWALVEAGHSIGGACIAVQSSIPQGAGLSSSAALELATGLALQNLFHLDIERPALAQLCQHAENQFVGMPCGIMDQFIVALGRRDHALLLDCRSLGYDYVPLRGAAMVVAHSGVRRGLVDSEYRVRRSQCESAVAKLAAVMPGVRALRDVSSDDLRVRGGLLSPVELRRARHVVSENERTLEAVAALKGGDLETFGELMVASHRSLRDDYEVSCPELDLLVDTALKIPGVYGSRMTGAGFGGCTITFARPENVSHLQEGLEVGYREHTGIHPVVFASGAAEGAADITV